MDDDVKRAPSPGERKPVDFKRTANYYALLIGVIACVNFWIYWIQGSRLSLLLGIFCVVCVAGWLIAVRRVLK